MYLHKMYTWDLADLADVTDHPCTLGCVQWNFLKRTENKSRRKLYIESLGNKHKNKIMVNCNSSIKRIYKKKQNKTLGSAGTPRLNQIIIITVVFYNNNTALEILFLLLMFYCWICSTGSSEEHCATYFQNISSYLSSARGTVYY